MQSFSPTGHLCIFLLYGCSLCIYCGQEHGPGKNSRIFVATHIRGLGAVPVAVLGPLGVLQIIGRSSRIAACIDTGRDFLEMKIPGARITGRIGKQRIGVDVAPPVGEVGAGQDAREMSDRSKCM